MDNEENKVPSSGDTFENKDSAQDSAENTVSASSEKAENTAENPQNGVAKSNGQMPYTEPVFRVPQDTSFSPNYHSQAYVYTANAAESNKPPKPPKKHGGNKILKVVALVLVCALVSAGVSVGTFKLMNSGKSQTVNQVVLGSTEATSTGNSSSTSTISSGTMASSDIYTMACEQVVGISTSLTTTNVFGQQSSAAVTGTGFFISTDGYILTNYHVIEYAVQYNTAPTVMTYDGTSYTAEIIGYDEDDDIAVLKIDATGLTPVTFGNSDDIAVGDTVYAVGNPLGELTYTMTDGIVSATNRVISTSASVSINMFQINAAVNSGNSGGPVYNAMGKVIGIVTAKYSDTGVEGLGFAIPINDAYNIATELIENGYVSGKAALGIEAKDVEDYVSVYYNLPTGAYVVSVNPNSAAENAGIEEGDIITAVGSTAITSVSDLKTVMKSYSAGETANLTIYRSGQTLTVSVVFDESTNTSSTTTTDTTTSSGFPSNGSSNSSGGSGN